MIELLSRALAGVAERSLPRDRVDEMLSDLDERFESRRRRDGQRAAAWWRLRQLVALIWMGWTWSIREVWMGRVTLAGFLDGGWLGELRIGARSLAASPTWTVIAVLTLALGVGGNTAVFSVVDAVLLRPLPYENPHELVSIRETRQGQTWWSAAVVNMRAWRERSRSLEGVAWSRGRNFGMVTSDGETEQLRGLMVSANLLDLLSVEAQVGRGFASGEDEPGAAPVAILTHDAWIRRFAGDPELVGRTLDLDGIDYEVVGILPSDVAPTFLAPHDALVPLVFTEAEIANRGRMFQAVGRIRDGVSLDEARAEMAALGAELDAEAPGGAVRGWGVELRPLKSEVVSGTRTSLLILLGAVGFVLLIACANLANLMLARGGARLRDLALRATLGAGRGRLVRLLLVESLLVGVVGGALGLLLATVGTKTLLAIDPSALPNAITVETSARTLLATAGVTLTAVLLFGFLPALRLTGRELGATIHDGAPRSGRGVGHRRLGFGLIVAEVGMVVVLLVGALVAMRGIQALNAVDPGFQTEDRLAVRYNLSVQRYPDGTSRARISRQLLENVRAIPGVLAAGTISTLPLTGGTGYTGLHLVRSHPTPAPGDEPTGGMEVVSPGYFEAMGIPLLAGRDFDERDGEGGAPTAIVDAGFVERMWPTGDPLVDAVTMAPAGTPGVPWKEVVGVVGSVLYGLDAAPRPRMYVPESQVPFGLEPRTLVVRVSPGAQESVAPALRRAIQEADRLIPVIRVQSLEEVGWSSIARTRFQSTLLALFAVLALVLGALGVYGVVGYAVGRRTREVGVRLALGGQVPVVLAKLLREALVPVALGLVLGIGVAVALSRAIASLAFGVRPLDPVAYGLGPLLLLVVATLAAAIPTLRAARIDPAITLREE